MNLLDRVKFRYKIYIPAVFVLFVFSAFIFQNYYVSGIIEKKLISINKEDIAISKILQKIRIDISLLQNNFVTKTLQNKTKQIDTIQVKKSFENIEKKIDLLIKNPLFANSSIMPNIIKIKIRLKGYKAILLGLPDDYKESKEDAIYDIISLNLVYGKMEKELDRIEDYTKNHLFGKVISTKNIIERNTTKTIYVFSIFLVLTVVFGYFVKQEIKHSMIVLKNSIKSLNDFLEGRINNVEKINYFPKDELGDILQVINENIENVEELVSKERKLKQEIDNFNKTLKQRIKEATKEIMELNKEIEKTQREIIFIVGAIGEMRSKETDLHVKRVAEYSFILARLCGLSMGDSLLLRDASPMHDIGKIAIPDAILHKNGKLTPKEYKIMQEHTVYGYQMLSKTDRHLIKAASIVAYEHHEKWDGSGYPRGLKGEDIHIFGRITAIADVFDALGSDRVYKKAWPVEKILKLFEEEKGKHFDPVLVDIFLDNLPHFIAARENIEQYGDAENLLKLIKNYTDIIDEYSYVDRIDI